MSHDEPQQPGPDQPHQDGAAAQPDPSQAEGQGGAYPPPSAPTFGAPDAQPTAPQPPYGASGQQPATGTPAPQQSAGDAGPQPPYGAPAPQPPYGAPGSQSYAAGPGFGGGADRPASGSDAPQPPYGSSPQPSAGHPGQPTYGAPDSYGAPAPQSPYAPGTQSPYAPGSTGPYATGPQGPYGAQQPPSGGYGAAPYAAAPYPGPGPASRTDGVSIAALVTGILFMGVVPLVLGIVGLRRVKRTGAQGRGLAITGIVLGVVEILAWIGIGAAIALAIHAHQSEIDDLHGDCAGGDMTACDQLYSKASPGSDEEQFGATCGGRTDGYGVCASLDPGTGFVPDDTSDDAMAYGDDPNLDTLWDECAGGDDAACDLLFLSSPKGSDYEQFGATCGGRVDGTSEQYCTEQQTS